MSCKSTLLLAIAAAAMGCLPSAAKADFVVAAHQSDQIVVYTDDFEFKGYLDLDFSPARAFTSTGPTGLDLTSTGNIVAVSRDPSIFKEYDRKNPNAATRVVTQFSNPDIGGPIDVKLSDDDRRIFVGPNRWEQNGIKELDFAGNTVRTLEGLGSQYHAVAVLPGDVLWAGGELYPGRFDVFDLATNTRVTTIPLDNGQWNVCTMSYSPSTDTVLMTQISAPTDTVYERDRSGNFVRAFVAPPVQRELRGITRGPNNEVFATDIWDPVVLHWSADGTYLGEIPLSDNPSGPHGIVWSQHDIALAAPSPSGDFNGDGILDIEDLRILSAAIADGSAELKYDLDQSGLVDLQDRRNWVTEIRKTWIGDSNLDGEFNSTDLVEVLQAGKFETSNPAGWRHGDWDGDWRCSTSDFVMAFQEGGYEKGPRTELAPVPEPTTSVLLLVTGLMGGAVFRRRLWS